MRVAVLIGVSALLAGCSHATTGHPARTTSASPPSQSATTSTTKPVAAPASGAPISDVIAWVEAGPPTDAGGYHRATREGITTDLGGDIAFTTPPSPSGTTTCMATGRTLTCLVNLIHPPPRPQDVYGEWRGNWVDFDGSSLQVGSAQGDPGPFLRGAGAELPNGQTLSFGDYRCRTDRVSLFCVNYAHQSGARFAPAGVEAFGCLHPQVPAPADVGTRFVC